MTRKKSTQPAVTITVNITTHKVRRGDLVIVSECIKEHGYWKFPVFRTEGSARSELGRESVNSGDRLESAVQRRFLEATEKRVTLRSATRGRRSFRCSLTLARILDFTIGLLQRNGSGTWRCVQFEQRATTKKVYEKYLYR